MESRVRGLSGKIFDPGLSPYRLSIERPRANIFQDRPSKQDY